MSVPNTIAGQLHHTKPEHLVPGQDVGMEPVGETGLRVVIIPDEREATVTYDAGPDLYDVIVRVAGETTKLHTGIYCDQLGEIVWGEDSKPFTMPMVSITTWDEDGEAREEIIA